MWNLLSVFHIYFFNLSIPAHTTCFQTLIDFHFGHFSLHERWLQIYRLCRVSILSSLSAEFCLTDFLYNKFLKLDHGLAFGLIMSASLSRLWLCQKINNLDLQFFLFNWFPNKKLNYSTKKHILFCIVNFCL